MIAWLVHTSRGWELHVPWWITATTSFLASTWLVDRWFSRRPPRF
jgi:hypothetical protein